MSARDLTPLDATFLELEEADPGAHMHIGSLMLFAAPPDGGAPALAELRAHVDRRLDALPRYRMRLSRRATGILSWPSWEPHPAFDVAAHVTRAALPAPGDEAELLAWAGDFFSHRLDRARPLWEIVLLEGLEGGGWALATKTHHALVDGVGSVGVAEALLDREPGAAWGPPPGVAAGDGAREDGHGGLRALARLPFRAARDAAAVALHPDHAADALRRAAAMAELLVRDELLAAPATSLNVPIGEHRRLAAMTVPMSAIREVRDRHGGTMNDVVLALVTAGLRRVLLSRGEVLPATPLRAMVPVNLRPAGDDLALGNRVSSLFVHLPVGDPDPLARLAAVRADAARLKAGRQAEGGLALIELGGLAPPLLHAVLAQSVFSRRLFNVTVTNVPGPRTTLYALGAPMRAVVPLVPLAADHAVGVAVCSYAGDVCLCVNADRDTVPDVAGIVAGMRGELELLRGAGPGTAPAGAAARS
ncbi:MAG TPA: wax ester/triacylglycerol synthase family O-acyltransferase [Solirubrobacteraceae bacterium]|nr:wax ester/triacylglycerol synthase family O-acyltransferase [Solirubrobacteraceae bacterium]